MVTNLRIFLVLCVVGFGCKEKPLSIDEAQLDSLTVDESVVDSVSLGEAGMYKIHIRQLQNAEGQTMVEFDLYRKENGGWQNSQLFKMQKDPLTSLGVSFADFNNDGWKDMTFFSGSAARPSNDIKTLFIFNNATGQLTHIRNSADFPNLRYNDELKCVDAWLIYGGTATVFLKIEGDSLREFAGVELFDDTRTVYEIDEEGNKSILQKEEIKDLDVNTRYKTYNPLKARF
jgi:hypothetical protein